MFAIDVYTAFMLARKTSNRPLMRVGVVCGAEAFCPVVAQ